MSGFERNVLLAPDFVAHGAAALVKDPAQRWMLHQSLKTRRSYVDDVLDRANDEQSQMIWMLRQPDPVRFSYAAKVLKPDDHATRWMLRQPHPVRESYITDVITKG